MGQVINKKERKTGCISHNNKVLVSLKLRGLKHESNTLGFCVDKVWWYAYYGTGICGSQIKRKV